MNLVQGGTVSEPWLRTFAKLFELLGLPAQELSRLVENLRFAADTSADNRSGQFAPLMPQRVEQLTWLGLSPQTVAVLLPYVTLLPGTTPLNLNTASPEALCASVPTMGLADAQRLVTERDRTHFRSTNDAGRILGSEASFGEGRHSVATRFFEVRGRLRLDQMVVEERSVLQRDRAGREGTVARTRRGGPWRAGGRACAGRAATLTGHDHVSPQIRHTTSLQCHPIPHAHAHADRHPPPARRHRQRACPIR
jgi:general secretion pathway protein K